MDPLSVFVSSTGADMLPHRSAIRDVILKLGLSPIMMEYFPSSATSGTLASLTYVDRATIFLLILGWRYGVPPPGQDRSVTELEYERAFAHSQTRRMPLLLYVVQEETRAAPQRHSFNPAAINTFGTDAQSRLLAQKLQAFRALVLERHVCKFFATPEDLALQASTDLSTTIRGGFASQGHLAQAEQALARRDYATAIGEARQAVSDLPGNSTAGDVAVAARARFILALAQLATHPVPTLADTAFQRICDLLANAQRMQPQRCIYPFLLAVIKHQYAVNGFPRMTKEAGDLDRLARSLPWTSEDEADLGLIRTAAPFLGL